MAEKERRNLGGSRTEGAEPEERMEDWFKEGGTTSEFEEGEVVRGRVVHVGTSATMVANRSATPLQRREAVAEFAQRLFGHTFTPQQVIEETLVAGG